MHRMQKIRWHVSGGRRKTLVAGDFFADVESAVNDPWKDLMALH